MPMTYSVRLFKEALAGTWNGSVTKDVLILVAIMVAVSYTHLDVYKRQGHPTAIIYMKQPCTLLFLVLCTIHSSTL